MNPFGDNGYVRLPTTEGPGAPLPQPSRREEEEGWYVRESTLGDIDPSLPFGPPAAGHVHCISSHVLDHACDADGTPRG